VISVLPSTRAESARTPTRRRYLMCRPEHFEVVYSINPWMDPRVPVDRALALHQWEGLVGAFRGLGHRVDLLEPLPGQPDMVFAANGATVVDGTVLGARFRYPQRAAEAAAHRSWFSGQGFERVVAATAVNEGEGDLLVVGETVLAGRGFRTDPAAHAEAARVLDRPVVPLTLVDPRFYHLDTALAVLDDRTVAWYPPAFDAASRAEVAARYPDAVVADEADALVLGLNAVSDGRHVVLPAAATGLAAQLARRGYAPIPIELSELLKGGGGPKCCTLEIRP
jgi:N-dimethylarginine dimethylaminohydrolase